MQNYINNLLLGVAVGDAIGVPAEFRSRESLAARPITDVYSANAALERGLNSQGC